VGGITFLERPELTAAEIVLPAGALERVERHVAGTARRREVLRAAGQHLKRGLLLYGPPGTGKTHTVRYLISRMPDVTVVVLAGNALAFVKDATDLAHALQPAVVVMEDVDLIAEHREMHLGPQPLLFTLLDAMDGLTSEADVAFVLTTNRADLLEAALAQRPGRVDLAVQVPLPDGDARRRLVRLYARDLPFSDEVLQEAADRTEGATASFFKELFRRAVLFAAEAEVAVGDDALRSAVTEMLDDREGMTRTLLGHAAPGPSAGSGFAAGPMPGVVPGGFGSGAGHHGSSSWIVGGSPG
jgi:ATP-dependent 26S proteasome regulatory subunit